MAESVVTERIDAARRRLDCYGRLIDLQREQQRLLVEGRYAELADNLREHDLVLSEIAELEALEASAAETEADDVLADDYRAAVERLRSIVETNAALLRNAAEFVRFSMGVLAMVASGEESAGRTEGAALVLDMRV